MGTEWVLERFAPLWQWGCRPRSLKSVVQAEVQQIQPFLEEKGRLSARVGKGWGKRKAVRQKFNRCSFSWANGGSKPACHCHGREGRGEEGIEAEVQQVRPFRDWWGFQACLSVPRPRRGGGEWRGPPFQACLPRPPSLVRGLPRQRAGPSPSPAEGGTRTAPPTHPLPEGAAAGEAPLRFLLPALPTTPPLGEPTWRSCASGTEKTRRRTAGRKLPVSDRKSTLP